ncbi:MAG: hypothetical protein M1484_00955 [Patescibacteria group bacterium]|nr:hypothetical protein [Patescibacteria group bacterium]MCL5431648.1 hypothetical protein [Patescibacteria group bacterium]
MDIAKIAIRGSTQEHLEIADIRDDMVLMKDGSVAMVIQVSAVNFGLLSEKEQEAIIFAYAGLLNSLNFAVQIVIRSQRKDISHYVSLLGQEEEKQTNPLLKDQIKKYRGFILQTVKENNVLDKKFYIIIPFSSLELGVGSTAGGLVKRKNNTLPLPADTIIEKARVAILPKRDHILRQLGRLTLRAKQLGTAELIELFYEIYNKKGANGVPTTDAKNVSFEKMTP